MRNSLIFLVCIVLAACGGSNGGGGAGPGSCSNADQTSFVLLVMRDWYLWNDLLPSEITLSDYASPEALLADLITHSPVDGGGDPIDEFSFIGSAAADAAFFGQGQYEGFGFTRKILAPDDIRLTQVFADSPAGVGGLARGQRILELNGRTIAEIEAAEGIDAVFDVSPVTFLMQEPDGTVLLPITIAHDIVTINPIPQSRVIDAGDGTGRMVGYIELTTFVGTADPIFDTVFANFNANGVTDVIVDLRYNGGGLVSTANLLGDFLGGEVAENFVFSETLFNADRAAANNSINFFDRLANSVSLSRLVVIASTSTASASELVTNSMVPHVEVTMVGDTTFGKPVGQVGFEFCDKILRPTAFQTVNADGFGDYFDGIPVNCPVVDDLSVDVGVDTDPNVVAAMEYFATGACPAVAVPAAGLTSPFARQVEQQARPNQGSPAWREFAGAF